MIRWPYQERAAWKTKDKAKDQLIDELVILRKRISELEALEAEGEEIEEALHEREERYRAIVNAFDGIVYICSENFQIEFMNEECINEPVTMPPENCVTKFFMIVIQRAPGASTSGC